MCGRYEVVSGRELRERGRDGQALDNSYLYTRRWGQKSWVRSGARLTRHRVHSRDAHSSHDAHHLHTFA